MAIDQIYKRLSIFLMLFAFLLVGTPLSAENILIIEPSSFIVSAKKPGVIIDVPSKNGDLVEHQQKLVAVANNYEITTNYRAEIEGVINQYGENIVPGAKVQTGDFLVELLEPNIKVLITFDGPKDKRTKFDETQNICCLTINEKPFEISLVEIKKVKDDQVYVFDLMLPRNQVLDFVNSIEHVKNKIEFNYLVNENTSGVLKD